MLSCFHRSSNPTGIYNITVANKTWPRQCEMKGVEGCGNGAWELVMTIRADGNKVLNFRFPACCAACCASPNLCDFHLTERSHDKTVRCQAVFADQVSFCRWCPSCRAPTLGIRATVILSTWPSQVCNVLLANQIDTAMKRIMFPSSLLCRHSLGRRLRDESKEFCVGG